MLALTTPILNLLDKEGSARTAEDFELMKDLFYWMMPSSILLMLASWYSGLLNVNSKFHLSSFAILFYNIFFLVIGVGLSYIEAIGPLLTGLAHYLVRY